METGRRRQDEVESQTRRKSKKVFLFIFSKNEKKNWRMFMYVKYWMWIVSRVVCFGIRHTHEFAAKAMPSEWYSQNIIIKINNMTGHRIWKKFWEASEKKSFQN